MKQEEFKTTLQTWFKLNNHVIYRDSDFGSTVFVVEKRKE